MRSSILRRLDPRAVREDDDGMALILVIGTSLVVFTLIVTAIAYGLNAVKQAGQRSQFEQSEASAETGIDRTLAQLQDAFTSYNVDYPIPNVPTAHYPAPACNATPVTWPAVLANGTTVSDASGNFIAAGGQTAVQNEKTWAAQKTNALVSIPGCVSSSGSGQFVVLKPVSPLVNGLYPKYGKVYALGAVPAFGAQRGKTRLLKSEYVFMPYRPLHAVLTGGNLNIASSVKITGAAGVDPTVAGVHSNGSIDITGASPVVTGQVTSTLASSGTVSGQPISQTPTERVPKVSAESFYYQAPSGDAAAMSSWYDLCTDGSVRGWSSGGPCSGAVLTTAANIGWTYSNHVWTATRDSVSGTFYAYQSSVVNGTGNAVIPNMTVIASSQNPTNCSSKKYGNIQWDHYNLSAPAFHNTFFYADGDVVINANLQIGQGSATPPVVSGSITAGDQVYLETSSNSAVGWVVAADGCTTQQPSDSLVDTNQVKNMELYYDPNADAPFTSIITNTLWLDYSG